MSSPTKLKPGNRVKLLSLPSMHTGCLHVGDIGTHALKSACGPDLHLILFKHGEGQQQWYFTGARLELIHPPYCAGYPKGQR